MNTSHTADWMPAEGEMVRFRKGAAPAVYADATTLRVARFFDHSRVFFEGHRYVASLGVPISIPVALLEPAQ